VAIAQEAFFLPVEGGDRFCIWRKPVADQMSGVVIHAPAFAEEMNKARHVTAAAARSLASAGFGVLTCDLFGCGDSPGEFADAGWDTWVNDLVAATRWVRARNDVPVWIWGLRAGALLATEVVRRLDSVSLLLWQPVLSGVQHLTHFLRLGTTAGAAAGERITTNQLFDRLRKGECVEIAGYELSPSVAEGLVAARFGVPADYNEAVIWLQVGPDGQNNLSAASEAHVRDLRHAGVPVDVRVVHGPSFWQSVELEDCPDLINLSAAILKGRA